MNAEIIAVGTELLLGQIANTNAQFLSEQLAELGVNVYYHTVVGDNPDRLKNAIQLAESRADLVIFTGGLGPTKDDLTKETIANHLGKNLTEDDQAKSTIIEHFKRIGKMMTENNKKQALVIEGAKVLPNEHGMAPGMFIHEKSFYYMLLPGPPHELQPMFRNYGRQAILDQLESKEKIESRVLRYFGIGEAELAHVLDDIIMEQTNPTVAPLAGDGEVTIRITARHQDEDKAVQMIDQMEEKINKRVGTYFYGYDDTSLIRELLILLEKKNLTIAAAESLTGGLFQSSMTAIVGVSTMLMGGVVCYSNQAKSKLCQVNEDTLTTYGAVSEECAIELAENVRKMLDSDIGISFTGVAGPDEMEGNPVGTVWISISMANEKPETHLLQLAGSRKNIQKRTVHYGCYYLIQKLKNL